MKNVKRFHLNYSRKRNILITFVVLLLFMIYFFKSASIVLRSLTAFSTMLFFYVIDHFFNIKFRKRHYFFMFIIVIVGAMLSPLYFVYPSFDKIQHFFLPMLLCSIVFYMISKLELELKWKIVFTFFTVFAILGVFEIGEYTMDRLFDFKLQGVYLRDLSGVQKFNLIMDPLSDTMTDMALGIIGAGIYCISFAFYMRKKLHKKIFREH